MQLISTNPSENYATLGEVAASTKEDVAQAVERARKAQADWSSLSIDERCDAIRSFIQVSRARTDEINRIIATETGRPMSALGAHVDATIEYLEWYCDNAHTYLDPYETMRSATEVHHVHREPWGVIAAICPWNYPFANVAWQCGQALIAGNAIVYKNSEENPLFAALLAELINTSDIPDGVFNVLQGDGTVGRWMTQSDVDMISFTGSSATGREIAKVAAERFVPFIAELGGSSPVIVTDDMDIDVAARIVFDSRFFHSGQICASMKRAIVHERVFELFVERLVELVEAQRIGRAIDETTQMGPLVAERQVQRIESQVQDAVALGATVRTGAGRPEHLRGAYYLPTVLTDVTPQMRVWTEETFGPVLPVVPYVSDAQAIELANDTPYGLTSFVMTNDPERFSKIAGQINAGAVIQNGGTYDNAASPFGGYKASGMGRTHGSFGFHECTQVKLVSRAVDSGSRSEQ